MAQRVEFLRAVERNERETFVLLINNIVVAHRNLLGLAATKLYEPIDHACTP